MRQAEVVDQAQTAEEEEEEKRRLKVQAAKHNEDRIWLREAQVTVAAAVPLFWLAYTSFQS